MHGAAAGRKRGNEVRGAYLYDVCVYVYIYVCTMYICMYTVRCSVRWRFPPLCGIEGKGKGKSSPVPFKSRSFGYLNGLDWVPPGFLLSGECARKAYGTGSVEKWLEVGGWRMEDVAFDRGRNGIEFEFGRVATCSIVELMDG